MNSIYFSRVSLKFDQTYQFWQAPKGSLSPVVREKKNKRYVLNLFAESFDDADDVTF